MKADIILFEGRSFVSKLIRLVSNTKVTHAAIMVGDKVLMESWWNGVRLRRLKEKESDYYLLRHSSLTYEEKKKIASFVINSVKTRYDYKLFLGIGLNKIFGINTKWDNKDKYICTELVVKAYRSIGIELIPEDKELLPEKLLGSKHLEVIYKYKR